MNKKLALVTVCVLILFQACSSQSPTPVSEPTMTATLVPPTSTSTPTVTPTSTPTPIPLAWMQVYDGQDFERDMVSAFATDKTNPGIIYAGMKNSGVYKTIDGGLSWLPVNQGLVSKKVEALLIDSQNPLILYAGTVGGVFKTEDGGENWSRVGNGTYLLMDLQDNSHLYARDENAIYETTDQGNTWQVVYPLKKDCPDMVSSWAIHPTEGDVLFIGGGEACAGVYQSSNSGQTWSFLGLKDKPNLYPLAIGLDEQGNFSIYARYASSSVLAENGLYVSYDEGVTWSRTLDGEGEASGANCEILTPDVNNPAIIYCAGGRLYVSRKKGEAWLYLPDTQSKIFTAFHIDHPNGANRVMTGEINLNNRNSLNTDAQISITADDGMSWSRNKNGIGIAYSEIKIDPANMNRMFLATYYYQWSMRNGCTLYRSIDGEKYWSSIRVADWCGPSFDAVDAFYLIERGSLQKSSDGGENWLWGGEDGYQPPKHKGPNPPPEDPVQSANALPSEFQSISANPYTDNLIYTVGNTIYYSTNSGYWQLSEGSEDSWDVRLFYTDQSKMIFAIGRYHQKYSTDNGKTWQACGDDVTTSQSDSRLALDLQGERLYLATPGRGVLVSTDQCGSWQESNNGLGNLFVNTVAMDPNNSDTVYAGTDGGAYISFDGGVTWGQVNDGLNGSNIVYSIAVDSDSNVYAATPYGIFKLESR
jgi:photosystem II stability/assembly factor-like uncharacterized protein